MKKPKTCLDAWAEAHKRFHLSDLPIQMARELGLHPKKCGGLATHRQDKPRHDLRSTSASLRRLAFLRRKNL